MLNPFIVGRWDGNHVWLQWTPAPDAGYALRMRYWRPGKPDWTKWIDTLDPWPINGHYLRIPTHAQGTMVQAQLAIHLTDGELQWETAQARRFGFCEADFSFTSSRKVTLKTEDRFCAMVDADVAAYRLLAPLEVFADTPVTARMRSIGKSGNNQLDHDDHFILRPRPGLIVTNIGESRNDLEFAEGDSVKIELAPMEGEMVLALGDVNQPRL